MTEMSTHSIATLASGLRVLVIPRPGTDTVASRVYIRAGSRHDGERHGMTHVLEHMLFRGTNHRTSRQIYGEIEALGGRVNAETGKDNVSLSVVTGARYARQGLDVLSDVLLHPRLDEQDYLAERAVILEEITRRAEMRQVIWDLYDLTLWETHPLRHRVLGYTSVVEALPLEEVVAHYHRFVAPSACLLVVCGECDPTEVLDQAAALFDGLAGDLPVYPPVPQEPPLEAKRTGNIERSILQTHMVVGWPTVGLHHPDSYVLKVIDRILGVGGASRLYQELRERQSLVYFVFTLRAEHEDTGHFAVYTATNPLQVEQVVGTVLAQVARLRSEPVTPAELEAAKTNYEGSLAVSFETNLSLAGIVGVETLLTGGFESFEEAARRVRAVSAEDIMRVANQYLDPERYALATVGPQV
jgi:predicted Zn-dependent peptidase